MKIRGLCTIRLLKKYSDRLSEINRDFEKIAIIGFRAESWAKKLNLMPRISTMVI